MGFDVTRLLLIHVDMITRVITIGDNRRVLFSGLRRHIVLPFRKGLAERDLKSSTVEDLDRLLK